VVIDTGPTETRQNKPLFRVDHGVRPKNNLTEPALLEMSGNATNQELGKFSTETANFKSSNSCVPSGSARIFASSI